MAQENFKTENVENAQFDVLSEDTDGIKAAKALAVRKFELPPAVTRMSENIKIVAFHPANVSVFPIALMITIMGGQFWMIPLLLIGELIALFGIPRFSAFRRFVGKKKAEAERAAVAREREINLVQMSDFYKTELECLEFLVQQIRGNVSRYGNTASIIIDEQRGLDRLIHGYTQLAISHRARAQCLTLANRHFLVANIESLREKASGTSEKNMREMLERRLLIATKRLEHWEQVYRTVELIVQQLETITEIIQLIHAQSISPSNCHEVSEELDRFMEDLKDTDNTVRELSELGLEE